ncbi:hypothetical protein OIU79_004440 [Salix purpurea]|uniref:Uncharacterized protein n=1 Tax=Salix purpurea TaxID=77065 RepID=A0A9Q0UAD9_SALPP|nr:hypothetical protein OIU79_004440 [Salix purpurea]
MGRHGRNKQDRNQGAWSKQEDQKLTDYIRKHGEGCWRSIPQAASLIAGRLPGRTDNEVKNYWNSHLRRKLIKMGIDPNNHRLRQNLLRPHNPQHPATASSSSGLKTHQAIQQPTKSHVDKEQVSDAVSCLEDDTCALPDLNLDLTMSFHSPSAPDVEGNPKDSRPQLDTAPSPTLLLFQ